MTDNSHTAATLPIDTVPDATMLDALTGLFQAGGPVVAILLAMSVLAVTIVLVKVWQFKAAKIGNDPAVREALRLHRAGDKERALHLAQRSPSLAAGVLARSLHGQRLGLADHTVREEVVRHAKGVIEDLQSWFRPLEVIAALAP